MNRLLFVSITVLLTSLLPPKPNALADGSKGLTPQQLIKKIKELGKKEEEVCDINKVGNDLYDFPVNPALMVNQINFVNFDKNKASGLHLGIDIPLYSGTPLHCPDQFGCVVSKTYPEFVTINGMPVKTAYGNALLVYYVEANLFGFYAHLSPLTHKHPPEHKKAGQLILKDGEFIPHGVFMAKSGNSGSMTSGAHLHFSIYSNNDCSDGSFSKKIKLSVISELEKTEVFEEPTGEERSKKEKEIELSFLEKCKIDVQKEAKRACIYSPFAKEFLDPMAVFSDHAMQSVAKKADPNRVKFAEVVRLINQHAKLRQGRGAYNRVPEEELKFKDIKSYIDFLGEK